LRFIASGDKHNLIATLTEGRFREHWRMTKGKGSEAKRFALVLHALEHGIPHGMEAACGQCRRRRDASSRPYSRQLEERPFQPGHCFSHGTGHRPGPWAQALGYHRPALRVMAQVFGGPQPDEVLAVHRPALEALDVVEGGQPRLPAGPQAPETLVAQQVDNLVFG
jgi:hypothetical protein